MVEVKLFEFHLPVDAVLHPTMVYRDGQVAAFVEPTKLCVGRIGPRHKRWELLRLAVRVFPNWGLQKLNFVALR
jgi:hypothetical protein